MSDSIDNENVNSVDEKEEGKYVPKKAYEGVSNDLHKFKSKYRDAEAKATELEQRLKAIEEEKMLEKNQYKELFEQKTEEFEALRNEVQTKEEKYRDTAKRAALKAELGDIRSEYLAHANINAIELDENGIPSKESVLGVANDFREKHAVLIPSKADSSSTALPPTSEPPVSELTKEQLNEKLAKMSHAEKINFLKQVHNNN